MPKDPVQALLNASGYENFFDSAAVDGSFAIKADGTYILCICPCGCGSTMNLPLCQGEKVDRAWLWDGNREKPTLEPSIRDLSGCRFHGFLRAGVWTFTEDSGVK